MIRYARVLHLTVCDLPIVDAYAANLDPFTGSLEEKGHDSDIAL